MKNIAYFLFLVVFIGCQSDEKPLVSNTQLAGVYMGNYNCNGCDVGKWVVQLSEDKSATAVYFNKKTKDETRRQTGTWTTENESILLNLDGQDKPITFKVFNQNYIKTDLGRGQKPVLGRFEKGGATYAENTLLGADLYGIGKTNNWGFRMIFGKGMFLDHPKFTEEIQLPFVMPIPDYENHTYTWQWTEQGKNIELVITDKPCATGMPASMVLKVDGEARDGCVQYINPNFLLQNIWQLKRYKDEDLIAERYSRGLPILEIDAFNVMGMGHTGCNIWSGGLKLRGDLLVIMPGAMSNANCGWADFERDFVSTIGQEWRIVYKGEKLELWKGGKAVFEFDKLDKDAETDVTDTEDKNKVYMN